MLIMARMQAMRRLSRCQMLQVALLMMITNACACGSHAEVPAALRAAVLQQRAAVSSGSSSSAAAHGDAAADMQHGRSLKQTIRDGKPFYGYPVYNQSPLTIPRPPPNPPLPPYPESPPPPPPPPPPPRPPKPSPPRKPRPPQFNPPPPVNTPNAPNPPIPSLPPSPLAQPLGPAAWNIPQSSDAFHNYLWGVNGERWNPAGRLTDYSYAGYMGNDVPIPNNPPTANIRDYGAVGDGSTDDTNALLLALSILKSGVLYFPPGTYLLSTQIVVQQSNLVLRGAGQNATTLYFSRSLTDIYGQTWRGYGDEDLSVIQSDYKSGPGLLRFAGPASANLAGPGKTQLGVADPVSDATLLTRVVAPAARGDVKLYVANATRLLAGQMVTLALSDANSTLLNALYGYIPVPRACTGDCINEPRVMRFHSRIFAVRSKYIVLERPLPWDVNTLWSPELHAFAPGIQQSGVEQMTIMMKYARYQGHLLEEGWNGIEFAGAANCWARNVTIINADNPIPIWMSSFITVSNVTFDMSRSRGSYDCHHNVNVTWSQDVLVSNFVINQICVHDMTSFAWNNAVVFANGTAERMNLDHHLLFPFTTLWSNIYVGAGDRVFLNAGETKWGMASAALTTYWNIQASSNITSIPSNTNGPFGNFLRLQWGPPNLPTYALTTQNWLIDATINPPQRVVATPVDLYQAMVATRSARFVQLNREQL